MFGSLALDELARLHAVQEASDVLFGSSHDRWVISRTEGG
jgi:hypothetical protein